MKTNLTKDEASGMTINERLHLAGLMDDFGMALARKDKIKLESVLEKVYLSPEDIQFIINQLLK